MLEIPHICGYLDVVGIHLVFFVPTVLTKYQTYVYT